MNSRDKTRLFLHSRLLLTKSSKPGQACRSRPRKIPQKSRGVYLTFLPLPAPRRRGLVRCTPGHLLLPFQGNSPCADERGVSFPVSPEPETYPGGTASPLEESPQARKKAACIHRRPFPQRVGKKSKERKNNERYKQINGRSGCRTLPHGHGPSAQNLHDNHW